MMQPNILVVEDDRKVYAEIEQTIISMGYSCEFVNNQQDAIKAVQEKEFHLMLLDWQIPARAQGMTRLYYGRDCLEQVRKIKDKNQLPVVIMTAHLRPGFELMREMLEFEPTHFIPKPFSESGKTLPVVIREALATSKHLESMPIAAREAQSVKFSGGLLKLHSDRAELLGVEILSRRARLCLAVLRILAEKRSDGRFRTFTGQQLTEMLKTEFADINISGAIQSVRNACSSKLKTELNIECRRDDVIVHNQTGYSLNNWITLEILSSPTKQDSHTDVPSTGKEPANAPATPSRGQSRQSFILNQIAKGDRLNVSHIAQDLGCSEKTIRRDLEQLIQEGKVEQAFGTGYYKML